MAENLKKTYLAKLNNKNLTECELLEIILLNAFKEQEVKGVAQNLLAYFPNVHAVLSADVEEIKLVDGVSEKVAVYLKTLNLALGYMRGSNLKILSTDDFEKIISKSMTGRESEFIEVYLVQKSGKVKDVAIYTSRRSNRVQVTVAEVLNKISLGGAYGVYVAHNHVNCPPKPSVQDDNFTRKLIEACNLLGVRFYDHCIINSQGEIFSYLKSGRLASLINCLPNLGK